MRKLEGEEWILLGINITTELLLLMSFPMFDNCLYMIIDFIPIILGSMIFME